MKKRALVFLLAVLLLVSSMPIGSNAVASNTSFSTATTLTSQIGDQLYIDGLTSGQSQWYRVYATAGQWLYGAIYGIGSGHDWDLGLYDSANTQLTRSARYGQTIEYIGYTVPTSGYYYFKVNAYSISSTSSYCYFKAVLSSGTGSSSLNSNFDRDDAWYYLNTYLDTSNPVYPYWPNGDCANFVSQALKYSGMAMRTGDRDDITSWFANTGLTYWSNSDYSATWAGANSFTNHWGTNSMGQGVARAYECKYYIGQDIVENFSTIKNSLKVGDVVQWTWNSVTERYHTLAVYEITSDDVRLAAHTSVTNPTSLLQSAAAMDDQMIVIIRIKSGN